MEAYRRFETIREFLDNDTILNELVQYMSDDDLHDFCDHLSDSYDVDEEEEDEEEY